MKLETILVPFLALLLAGHVAADGEGRDLHVDPVSGNDRNDGVAMPVKTISQAIKLAQRGDTIHLTPTRYKESAVFANKLGEPGRPITLDGHGAVLDGAESLIAADWQMTAPGLYRNDRLLRMDPAILMRWFFVFDGKMNHMGRTSKGPTAPLKKPEELTPGEWTYLPDEPITRETKQITGAFFIKTDPAQTLDACRIEAPIRSAGVGFGGHCEHIVIRHVTSTHVHNDGFNIHGDQRGLVFENIAAIDCGDDGFSAHEAAECRIVGFVSIGNSTGLCDTVASSTHYKNVFIRDCLGYDVFFISHGSHSIENAIVESSAARAVAIGRDPFSPDGTCAVRFKNVLVRRIGGGPQEFRISAGAKLEAERCTFQNLMVQATPNSNISFVRCLITGDPKPELIAWKEVVWRGESNVYDLKSLRVDKTSFTPQTFAEFQKFTNSEVGSQWSAAKPPEGVGSDELALSRVPMLKPAK